MTDEKEKKQFDNTVQAIGKALSKEDPLGVVIRGHLFVESQLIQLLEEALPDPGAIDLSRLNFPTKVDLAVALKLFSELRKRGYLALNKLRNHLAHNIDVELRESDERRLLQALTEEQKKLAQDLIDAASPDDPWSVLRGCVASLCTDSSVVRFAMMRKKSK